MSNYKLITGPFEGSVVEEGQQVLDVPFEELDKDLQQRILYYGEGKDISDMNLLKQDFENSWQSEETEEEPDLTSVSKC